MMAKGNSRAAQFGAVPATAHCGVDRSPISRPAKRCRIADILDGTPDSQASDLTPPPACPVQPGAQPSPTLEERFASIGAPTTCSASWSNATAGPSPPAVCDRDVTSICTCQYPSAPAVDSNEKAYPPQGPAPSFAVVRPLGRDEDELTGCHGSTFAGLPAQAALKRAAQDEEHAKSIAKAKTTSFATGDVSAAGVTRELLVQMVTRDLEDVCEANEGCTSPSADAPPEIVEKLKMFYSAFRQPFSLEFYVQRLVQYSNCSTSAFIVAMVYLDRLQQNTPGLRLSYMNCHRLLIVSLVLAIKYLDDEIYSNSYYARVGGLSTAEMNRLETAMLGLLQWNVSVSSDMYSLFEESLASGICSSDGEDDADELDGDDDEFGFSTSSLSTVGSRM
jgi:hypothetical protein